MNETELEKFNENASKELNKIIPPSKRFCTLCMTREQIAYAKKVIEFMEELLKRAPEKSVCGTSFFCEDYETGDLPVPEESPS